MPKSHSKQQHQIYNQANGRTGGQTALRSCCRERRLSKYLYKYSNISIIYRIAKYTSFHQAKLVL